MAMTSEELAELDKLLRRMAKNAKAWAFTRWIGVVLGPLMIACSAHLYGPPVKGLLPPIPKDPSAIVSAGDLWVASRLAVGACILWAGIMFQGVLGIWMLLDSALRWHKGRNDALLIKMARSWMESQQSPSPSSSVMSGALPASEG